MYSFINDYSEGAHESILNALVESNLKQSAGYGLDEYCESAKDILKNVLKNNEIDKTNEKLRIAHEEQAEYQRELSSYGVQFDAQGVMTNYAQVFSAQQAALNSVYNHYNSLSAEAQKGYEDQVKAAEKKWNTFKETVSNYDKLTGSTIPGLEQSIQDAIDNQIEIKIKEFDMEIELALDIKDAQDKWNEFKKNIIKD